MAVTCDLIIRDGMVVDPYRNFKGIADVLILDGKIIETPEKNIIARQEINAAGHLVVPGLIDFHTHLFPGGTAIGISPDVMLLPQGVTTAVDQGSCGVDNFESFYSNIIGRECMRIFAYLHPSPTGLSSLPKILESVDPQLFDFHATKRLFEKYNNHLVGLKVRQSLEIVKDFGLEPLQATVKMANQLGVRVVVHSVDPPGEMDDLLEVLRAGDICTHVYHGNGNTILTLDGKVRPKVWEARKRGVIFDTADARVNHSLQVIQAALHNGFESDIISTDVVAGSIFDKAVFGLPNIISKYLALKLPLEKIIQACTCVPAEVLGMKGKIGTLAEGALADVAIFELKNAAVGFQDCYGAEISGSQMFLPRLTIVGGKVVYRSLEF